MIVIHEIPGITPKVAAFADDVVERGFTVVMPDLVGTPGKDVGVAYLAVEHDATCASPGSSPPGRSTARHR